MKPEGGQLRAVISGVSPEIEAGRHPVKRTVGEKVVVTANIFLDGHDAVAAELLYRRADANAGGFEATPLVPLGNDRWRAAFTVRELGGYRYTIRAWADRFGSWRRDLVKRVEAGQDVAVDLAIGADLVAEGAKRARGPSATRLREIAAHLTGEEPLAVRAAAALGDELADLMNAWPDRSRATRYERELEVWVDRERARFSAWYEVFPRSTSPEPGRHGTFADLEARLDYIAELGFDVVYLPPIHPIGTTHRKGKNNDPAAKPGDVGSPWAIGGAGGGHKAIHPELGTFEDFDRLVARAKGLGMEVALDIAFQCSPDHPYAKEHPEWFRKRPDGTIQYAENPPKKYEDIYPFDFETKGDSKTEGHEALWAELLSVVRFWSDRGVRVFRVDNPHTKPFRFWEWLIAEIRSAFPETLFLAEAFTRPRVMEHLAKIGFSQSYTYFTWRDSAEEMREYLTELTRSDLREYFRPNFWPNTPDILPEHLQDGGRAAFLFRLVLAATLSANYGIYGPAFELLERVPRERGSEEYLDSEKYELRHWDLDDPASIRGTIARLNRIRRENPALQSNRGLVFHGSTNDRILAYSKVAENGAGGILIVVSFDPDHVQSAWITLDLGALGLSRDTPFTVHDLLDDSRYQWGGLRNYVALDPAKMPAHVFRIEGHARRERDYEYYE